jgi:hypothetical protein
VKQLVNSIFKFSITFCLLFIGNSCQKSSTPVDSNTATAQDHIMVETHIDDIVTLGLEASYGSLPTYMSTTCTQVSFNNSNPADNDTMYIDFNKPGIICSGVANLDGRYRTGILQYIYKGGFQYRDSANVINVSWAFASAYIVDGNGINFNSFTIQNMGHITNGNLTYDITANVTVNKSGGGNIQCTSTKTKVLIAGEQPSGLPIDWTHTQMAVFGTATGTSADGVSYTASITQANWLVRNFNCTSYRKCFVAGIEDFTPNNKPTRSINFGTGACDNQAVISINGYLFTETLP